MGGIIVGLDPGTTTGICVLDLKGNLRKIHSEKHLSFEGVLSFLSSSGEPVVIASDVHPAPSLVEKVAATFNSVLFTPLKSISGLEKVVIIGSFLERNLECSLKNKHEKDALVAGLLAYYNFENKLKQVEKKMREKGIGNVDEVKKMVLKGTSMSRAVKRLETGKNQ